MSVVIGVFVFAGVVAIAGISLLLAAQKKTDAKHIQMEIAGVFVLFFAGLFFTLLVFCGSPIELGYSCVPTSAEKYTRRLDNGVTYQLVAADKDGDDQILLLRQYCPPWDYRAIRVKASAPPVTPGRQFALVNGNPVEIVLPLGGIIESPCNKK
jgi:hypothetical protein